ncbi:peptide chain release factor N(5)-glutamine methyltransferase [Cupriavidus plantarum]|uniref:peptide chain release factor N(5)-glutamine methyltransferase n=1 Tax=Cupriavidus plantarum TaxID=942865 RepID=UPI000E24BB20|nr:peptide chain release factor N(5)-glutamine methyltransferase [Cupriavidus plantarum]REE87212.1 [protein release factor]-glutamine N5-methyltransferase [Cupriavidus plantarum]CAG2152648.1 Release factor glutamine methyltransferase [Cupriavidus plantarum]SMR86357.1 [protein release factor]-glutamine N5-methyltransferase [Cupriavidus plantarum]
MTACPPTVREAQMLAARAGLPTLEARMLLTHVTGLSRTQLITRDGDPLTAAQHEALASLLARRLAGEPMAYLLGEREFFGRTFHVTPDVLIPRPDTEIAVEAVLTRLDALQTPRVLDLGTGSGALAVTIACERPDAEVWATDISEGALAVAQRNARTLGAANVHFRISDWYDALPDELRFDLIVSNPPYIAAGDPHLAEGDLRFEPIDALTDHGDGLSDLAAIVAGAAVRLKPGGWLLMEHGYDQAAATRALLERAGYAEVFSARDLGGHERCTGGRLSA